MAREIDITDLPRLGDLIVVDGERKYTVTSSNVQETHLPRNLKDPFYRLAVTFNATDRPGDDHDDRFI